jgi:hypothetical protein
VTDAGLGGHQRHLGRIIQTQATVLVRALRERRASTHGPSPRRGLPRNTKQQQRLPPARERLGVGERVLK